MSITYHIYTFAHTMKDRTVALHESYHTRIRGLQAGDLTKLAVRLFTITICTLSYFHLASFSLFGRVIRMTNIARGTKGKHSGAIFMSMWHGGG